MGSPINNELFYLSKKKPPLKIIVNVDGPSVIIMLFIGPLLMTLLEWLFFSIELDHLINKFDLLSILVFILAILILSMPIIALFVIKENHVFLFSDYIIEARKNTLRK